MLSNARLTGSQNGDGRRLNTARAVGTKNINKWLTRLVVLGLIGQNSNKWSKIS